MQLGEFGIGSIYNTQIWFILITCLLDIVLILKGEILSRSLMEVLEGLSLCYCPARFSKKNQYARLKETRGTYCDMLKFNTCDPRKYTLDLKKVHPRLTPIYLICFVKWFSVMETDTVSVEPRWKRDLELLCKAPRAASNFITSSLEKCFYRWVTSILPSIAGTGITRHGWDRIVLIVK